MINTLFFKLGKTWKKLLKGITFIPGFRYYIKNLLLPKNNLIKNLSEHNLNHQDNCVFPLNLFLN